MGEGERMDWDHEMGRGKRLVSHYLAGAAVLITAPSMDYFRRHTRNKAHELAVPSCVVLYLKAHDVRLCT